MLSYDAVVPITKAKQVVIVGDSQQMPPTSFFDRTLVGTTSSDDDDLDFDSILERCGALLPSKDLLWHYRSQDERLITFSNENFYKGGLLTFPSSWAEHPNKGIKFVYLADAIYGRGGSRANPQEAEKAVDLLLNELKEDSSLDIAITALSVAQSEEIQNRIENRAPLELLLQKWLDQGGHAKNLETIQGDQCDVMILCFGYGKDASGNLQLNFGPLSRENGYKRLNVAITRARQKMIVVASIKATDIPPGAVGVGGGYVRSFLDYAERGMAAITGNLKVPSVSVYESLFEEAVANRLRSLGWAVYTQVGVSRYRVDLAVRYPDEPGRYLAGIECDGAMYHSAETARDRDIIRQEVLQRLDWKLYRIWSTDWFQDSNTVLKDVNTFLRELLSNRS